MITTTKVTDTTTMLPLKCKECKECFLKELCPYLKLKIEIRRVDVPIS